MSGFNFPNIGSSNSITIPSDVQYAIGADGINVKVLPSGSAPNVVYRIGDGTVHPEGWDNVDGNKYLDFYITAGEQGIQGINGVNGQNGKTPIYDFSYNESSGELEYSLVGYNLESELNTVTEW